MKTITLMVLGGVVSVVLTGCGADPISYSEAIGINLKVKSGEAKDEVIQDEKSITTESGNPFGAFLKEAAAKLGQDPARVELSQLTLSLGAKTTGATALEEIFVGEVQIMFLFNESKNTLNVGQAADPTGPGPVSFAHQFEFEGLNAADRADFLSGSFKVVIRGSCAAQFEDKKIEAELLTTLSFEAFE